MKKNDMVEWRLACVLKVHKNTVGRWIRNETEPSASNLYKMARVFRIPMEKLMEEPDEEEIWDD